MNKTSPCFKCQNSGTVHTRCDKYDEYKADNEAEYKLKLSQKKIENYFAERVIRSMDLGSKTNHIGRVVGCAR